MSLSPTVRVLLLTTMGQACTPAPCPKGSARQDDGLCYLSATGAGGVDSAAAAHDSGTDSGTLPDPTHAYIPGDPIQLLGAEDSGGGHGTPIAYEWTDAAAINDTLAIVTGQGGYGLIDMASGALLYQENTRRALRVATDGRTAILASRNDGLMKVDVSAGAETRGAMSLPAPALSGVHEDVDVDGDRILIGWHSEGGVLLQPDGSLLGVLPATDAFAVALSGDRALITDGSELVLFDITVPATPVELDRQAMSGEGRDLAWEGHHAVVGMGGAGASVWETSTDGLVHRGDIVTPGSALSVAIDEDRAWIGAWEVTALVDLAAEPPVVLGHETPLYSAMGVGAAGGRAVVADWFASTALQAEEGVAGPELVMDSALFFDPDAPSTRLLEVSNHGPLALEWATDAEVDGYTVSPPALTLAPGERTTVRVEWAGSTAAPRADLAWRANDPDEASGVVS